jgi:Transposase DDE domain
MAGFTKRLSKVANGVFTISAMAYQWSVGRNFDRLNENRAQGAKKNEYPSLFLGDSMCAKNTDTANIETKGYCHYKSTNGIKRHLLVDVLGNPYFVKCTAANISDDEGLLEIIKANKEYFLNLPDEHIITILLDNGYHKEFLEKELEKIDKQLRSKIKIEISAKITPEQKVTAKQENPAKQGFVVIFKRWIVERSNAWINQCRVLWKNCEGLLETSETKIRICAIRLILRRIA